LGKQSLRRIGRRARNRQYRQVVSKPLLAAFAVAFPLYAHAQQAYAPINFALSTPLSSASGASHAPPLPFRYVGRLNQNGKSEILLMRGTMLHSVAEGDEIDGEYRVERITGASIHFTYLPGVVKQNLDLTAAR
jgi:hypothetical protein